MEQFLETIDSANSYVLVQWPESQELMDKEWFDECHLINDEMGLEKFGSSAYFVPEDRYVALFLKHKQQVI